MLCSILGSKYRWSEDHYDMIFSFRTALTNMHIRFHSLSQKGGDDYRRFKTRLFQSVRMCLRKGAVHKHNTERGEERTWIGIEAMNKVWEHALHWVVSSTPMMKMILMMIRNLRICMLFFDTSYIVLLLSNCFM